MLDKAIGDDDKESKQKTAEQRQQIANQKFSCAADEVVPKYETDATEGESQSKCLPACHVITRNHEVCDKGNKEWVGVGHDGGSTRAGKVCPYIERSDLRYK